MKASRTHHNSKGNPFGLANIGSDLVANQDYDVSVHLYLPRTPANTAAGNFMLDLDLYSKEALLSSPSPGGGVLLAGGDDSDYSADPKSLVPFRISQSRRTAILPYTSYLVSLAYRIARLPIYVLGFCWEAEHLKITMLERISFESANKNVPALVKLSVDSFERMQIYKATVRFDAKFSGLRYGLCFFAISFYFSSIGGANQDQMVHIQLERILSFDIRIFILGRVHVCYCCSVGLVGIIFTRI